MKEETQTLARDSLQLLAPWLAVGIGWLWLENAWAALGLYHVQILGWAMAHRARWPSFFGGNGGAWNLWALLALGIVPATLWLLPMVTRMALADWFVHFGLSSSGSLILMLGWFGLVHPILEEGHWAELRMRRPWAACLAFGGYHALVMTSLLGWPLALGCALVLAGCSWVWRGLQRASGSLWPAITFHTLADLGLAIAIFAVVMRKI